MRARHLGRARLRRRSCTAATAIFAMPVSPSWNAQSASLLAFVPASFSPSWSTGSPLFLSPKMSTLAVIVVIPPLLYLVSYAARKPWATGSATDSMPIPKCSSHQPGRFSDSPVGQYLHAEIDAEGTVVADILCYQLTRAAIRAKGILMMREAVSTFPSTTRPRRSSPRCVTWNKVSARRPPAIQPMLHMTAVAALHAGKMSPHPTANASPARYCARDLNPGAST